MATGLRAASRELAGLDPVFARLVVDHGPPRYHRRPRVDERFEDLARSICYQQLAGAAAAAIWARVQMAVDPFDADTLVATPETDLRAAGLSGSKTASMLDLAHHVTTGAVDLVGIGRRDDETVVAELTQVRGIGRWTAQMFLMFGLRRPDVWPVTDLGVRLGWQYAHDLAEMPEPRALDEAGERLRPHRSVAAWYCWQEVHARRGR